MRVDTRNSKSRQPDQSLRDRDVNDMFAAARVVCTGAFLRQPETPWRVVHDRLAKSRG